MKQAASALGRIAAGLLLVLPSACATTSTVQQQHAQPRGQAYAYTFENNGGDDLEGIAELARLIRQRLDDAGLLARDGAADGRVEVELTHYYVRSDTARFLAGIMAGRDRIASQVTIVDPSGRQVGRFEVDTTNLTAWGSKDGLMRKHADEIVARAAGG